MNPASPHPFLVSHGLFCLDLGQDVYEKGGFFSCKVELGVGLERNVFAMGCMYTGVLHGP